MTFKSIKPNFLTSHLSVIVLCGFLSACAVSVAADKSNLDSVNSQSVDQATVAIDWDSANEDANDNSSNSTPPISRSQNSTTPILSVPLLLPPESIVLSDTSPPSQPLSPAQVITDKRGYSAAIEAETFTILIDSSNRTFVTNDTEYGLVQNDFDGDYLETSGGGQITIGRYGALYAIQLLCSLDSSKNCITERMVREVIESLLVKRSIPK